MQSCKILKHLSQLQTQVLTNGFEQNQYITPRFVTACAQLKQMGIAQRVFDKILEPKTTLWNSMIKGFAQNGHYEKVLVLFSQMTRMDFCVTQLLYFSYCPEVLFEV